MISLENLTTGYGNKIVTENISTSLMAGELTCLIGPNGAGKSTLMRTLCGFIPPIGGDITIDGQNLKKISQQRMAKSVGIVLTQRPAAINMTVEELVAIGRSPYTSFWGTLSATDSQIVEKAIDMVGISHLRKREIGTLSDGERQKAMIAKTLAQQTQIIFLDEPTAFLDYPSKAEILKLLLGLAHEENKTIFLSTHDLELALQIADKIWLLDRTAGLSTGVTTDPEYMQSLAEYFKAQGIAFDAESMNFKIMR